MGQDDDVPEMDFNINTYKDDLRRFQKGPVQIDSDDEDDEVDWDSVGQSKKQRRSRFLVGEHDLG